MPSARAQRGAESDLALTWRGLCQQKVSDIGAGDQQHEADRGQQDIERQTNVAHDVFEIRSRAKIESRAGREHVRKSVALILRNRAQIGSDAFLRYAWTQTSDHVEEMRVAHLDFRISSRERNPKIDGFLKLEVVWQDTDDLIVDIVEVDRLAEHVLTATEPALPETISDQRYLVATLGGFLGQKIAAAHRLHSERREK